MTQRSLHIAVLLVICACGGDHAATHKTSDAGMSSARDAGGRVNDAGSQHPADAMPLPSSSMQGTVDDNAGSNSGLPALPRMTSVTAQVVGDSVSLKFDPVDDAADYRVYELPDAAHVVAADGGGLNIDNGVFRCAGDRQAPAVAVDGETQLSGGAVRTLVDGQDVKGVRRMLADATLGYVYQEPGDGRVPVFALGENKPNSDNSCFFQRWTASRRKQYVTSSATRASLLAQGFRDDGIAFYVPASAGADTRAVLTSSDPDSDMYGARYYFIDGPETAARMNPTNAFVVRTQAGTDTTPLMRVFYTNMCGQGHDELVAGKPRFDLAREQGDHVPLTRLHWSGLTKATTLVVEALDQGCPFQGIAAPMSVPANGMFAAWTKLEDIQASAPHHELYINGQFDGTTPKPIARAFVRVAPAKPPELDWSFGFDAADDLGDLVKTDITAINCAEALRMRSNDVDVQVYCPEAGRFAHRSLFGEWWVYFTDNAADTAGKYRLTPLPKADMAADSFLYTTMDVDSFSTLRRYPQILISDRDAPVQNALADGNTLLLQTFADWPNTYELQVCDHRNWDVNDQCPKFDLYQQRDANDSSKIVGLAPNVEVGEQVGLDYANRWELYASTKRAYVFLDGQPYGCADLPAQGVPSGSVTVTFGDVLYHSGVDHLFTFTSQKLQSVSVRHFDNLGFKSHVGAPTWDEKRLPCAKQTLSN